MNTFWKGRRILILGAARQGVALARWLSGRGAHVTLSDSRSEPELASTRADLASLPIQWSLGGHPLELLDECDLLCISGGVPLNLPIVKEAFRRGIPLSNDTQIFLEVAPCKTVGITGSAGKTTTSALVGAMAKTAYADHSSISIQHSAFIGGNIGDPLINHVDKMKPDDLAILEVSSFQLEQMTISPEIAAVLNVTPNHLDRHANLKAYTAAKARILEFQSADDTAVLGRDDAGAWGLRDKVKGQLLTFSLRELDEGLNGAYFQNGWLNLRAGNNSERLLPSEKITLRGDHNLSNVLAAFTIGHAAGLPVAAMVKAAEDFRAVPHRLELVRDLNGVRWYNDSIATAPERTMAALRAFDEPIILLLGGRDKDLPWDGLAALIRQRVDHVLLFGEAAEKISDALGPERGRPFSVIICDDLKDAVIRASIIAEPGNIVLLAPGGTSYDAFKDFEERGEKFRQWVLELS